MSEYARKYTNWVRKLVQESHKRQFNGEDYQKVAMDIAQANNIDPEEDAAYLQIETEPKPDCLCGFCAPRWLARPPLKKRRVV